MGRGVTASVFALQGYWRLFIPKGNMRLKLLKEYHDLPSAVHQGRHRTYTRMCRHVYWPRMCMDVQRYVRSCDLCQRMKWGRRNNGLLQPLPIPDRPWQDIRMDLITGLPLTANGFDAIFTFVDRLSKSVHLCPTSALIDAAGAAKPLHSEGVQTPWLISLYCL